MSEFGSRDSRDKAARPDRREEGPRSDRASGGQREGHRGSTGGGKPKGQSSSYKGSGQNRSSQSGSGQGYPKRDDRGAGGNDRDRGRDGGSSDRGQRSGRSFGGNAPRPDKRTQSRSERPRRDDFRQDSRPQSNASSSRFDSRSDDRRGGSRDNRSDAPRGDRGQGNSFNKDRREGSRDSRPAQGRSFDRNQGARPERSGSGRPNNFTPDRRPNTPDVNGTRTGGWAAGRPNERPYQTRESRDRARTNNSENPRGGTGYQGKSSNYSPDRKPNSQPYRGRDDSRGDSRDNRGAGRPTGNFSNDRREGSRDSRPAQGRSFDRNQGARPERSGSGRPSSFSGDRRDSAPRSDDRRGGTRDAQRPYSSDRNDRVDRKPADRKPSDQPYRRRDDARSDSRDNRGASRPSSFSSDRRNTRDDRAPRTEGRSDSRDSRGDQRGDRGQSARPDRSNSSRPNTFSADRQNSRDDRPRPEGRFERSSSPRPAQDRDGQRDDRRNELRAKHSSRPLHNTRPIDDETLAKQLLQAPELPEGIEFSDLDPEIRVELRTLPKGLAETVGKHLVAAGGLVDSDPEAAFEHANYAKQKASRIPIVREALGLAAYHAGKWAEALSELRAVRRMTQTDTHVAIIADTERALGRPEKALDFAKEINVAALPTNIQIELKIVTAGARRDLGQLEAAVVSLQGKELNPEKRDPWSARLFYAYADNLAAAGRQEEAVQWFMHTVEADPEGLTDAEERATELAHG